MTDTQAELLITYGDCELIGRCNLCDRHLTTIRPDQSMDIFMAFWDLHMMTREKCIG